MCGAPAMICSASASASANACVRTLRSQLRREPEARQVIEGQHGLVGAHVPGMRDPPAAVLAALVAVLVERRALYHHAVLGGDHGVLERPGPAGLVAVDGDLRLAG